jgi:hypothetical protein
MRESGWRTIEIGICNPCQRSAVSTRIAPRPARRSLLATAPPEMTLGSMQPMSSVPNRR